MSLTYKAAVACLFLSIHLNCFCYNFTLSQTQLKLDFNFLLKPRVVGYALRCLKQSSKLLNYNLYRYCYNSPTIYIHIYEIGLFAVAIYSRAQNLHNIYNEILS